MATQTNNATGKQIHKPWLDQRGFLLSDTKLKLQSKKWDIKTWSDYLDSVDEGKSQIEQVMDPIYYETYSQDCSENVFSQNYSSKNLSDVLKLLNSNERKVIKYLYWEGIGLVEISKKMKFNRTTVYRWKISALNKIKASREIEAIIKSN